MFIGGKLKKDLHNNFLLKQIDKNVLHYNLSNF